MADYETDEDATDEDEDDGAPGNVFAWIAEVEQRVAALEQRVRDLEQG